MPGKQSGAVAVVIFCKWKFRYALRWVSKKIIPVQLPVYSFSDGMFCP